MKIKVLYAEDKPTLAQIIGDGLASSGYQVLSAYNGQQALDSFRADTPIFACWIL